MPDDRDWGDGLFVIVYATLARDHPSVWRDLNLSGAWLHCLMTARGMRGAPFMPPREVPDETVALLIADDILDPVGDGLYLFHGLDRETEGQAIRGSAGGRARAVQADRIAGRFAPATPPATPPAFTNGAPAKPTSDATSDATSKRPAKNAGGNAGHQRTSEESRDETSRGGVSSTHTPSTESDSQTRARDDRPRGDAPTPAGVGVARSEVGGGRYGTPDVPTCSDPTAHTTDWRYYVGVGWKCLACDTEGPGDRSFREKARDHGAQL